jgi:hypothetical protein
MSDSFTNYPKTNLEKIKKRSRRTEMRNWEEYQERMLERQLKKERDLADYLRLKGETD